MTNKEARRNKVGGEIIEKFGNNMSRIGKPIKIEKGVEVRIESEQFL